MYDFAFKSGFADFIKQSSRINDIINKAIEYGGAGSLYGLFPGLVWGYTAAEPDESKVWKALKYGTGTSILGGLLGAGLGAYKGKSEYDKLLEDKAKRIAALPPEHQRALKIIEDIEKFQNEYEQPEPMSYTYDKYGKKLLYKTRLYDQPSRSQEIDWNKPEDPYEFKKDIEENWDNILNQSFWDKMYKKYPNLSEGVLGHYGKGQ